MTVRVTYYPLVYNELFSIDFFKIKESQDKTI